MFFTIKEKSLAHNTSHDALRGYLRNSLRTAHGVEGWDDRGPWVMDVFPDNVVYMWEGKTYRRKYTVTQGAEGQDPTITMGNSFKPVHVAYVDSKDTESLSVILDDVNFTQEPETVNVIEGIELPSGMVVKEGKGSMKIPIKIIGPGWGSSAYYSKEVLQRDGPKVFKKGTHMQWNHPTATEESERPEGDLDNLAAVLTSDAVWKENGEKGPGLYAEAKVFSDYAQQVADKGPHIGVSINAAIQTHEGEAEGKTGRIADKFVYAFSTDFVTKAGAGGAPIVTATESDRAPKTKETDMTDQEIKALKDSIAALEAKVTTLTTENAALKSANAAMEADHNRVLAVSTVGSILREAGIEFKQSLLERVCAAPVMKEGKVDSEWVKSVVADMSEGQKGRVTGMGRGKESADETEVSEADQKQLWQDLGIPEAGLKYAMGGKR